MALQPIQGEIKITRVNQGVLEVLITDLINQIIALQADIVELIAEMDSANATLLSSLTHHKYASDTLYAMYSNMRPAGLPIPLPPVTSP